MSEVACAIKTGISIAKGLSITAALIETIFHFQKFFEISQDAKILSVQRDVSLQFFTQDNQNKQPLELYFDGKRCLDNHIEALNNRILDQKVIKIRRLAMSLWGKFPSGVASIFSQIFTNQCIRHEYILIYTEKYIISAEISKSKDCINPQCLLKNTRLEQTALKYKCDTCKSKFDVKKGTCFQIMIWQFSSLEEKKKIIAQYKKRDWCRTLNKLSVKQNNIAENIQMKQILLLWFLILKTYQIMSKDPTLISQFYNLLTKNCKTFARATFYFFDKGFNKEKIFQSILGQYVDKPGKIFFDPISERIQYIGEKALNLKGDYLKNKEYFMDIIQQFRYLN